MDFLFRAIAPDFQLITPTLPTTTSQPHSNKSKSRDESVGQNVDVLHKTIRILNRLKFVSIYYRGHEFIEAFFYRVEVDDDTSQLTFSIIYRHRLYESLESLLKQMHQDFVEIGQRTGCYVPVRELNCSGDDQHNLSFLSWKVNGQMRIMDECITADVLAGRQTVGEDQLPKKYRQSHGGINPCDMLRPKHLPLEPLEIPSCFVNDTRRYPKRATGSGESEEESNQPRRSVRKRKTVESPVSEIVSDPFSRSCSTASEPTGVSDHQPQQKRTRTLPDAQVVEKEITSQVTTPETLAPFLEQPEPVIVPLTLRLPVRAVEPVVTKKLKVQVTYLNGATEKRAICVTNEQTFQQVIDTLIYCCFNATMDSSLCFEFQYADTDGDSIVCSSNDEWKAAWSGFLTGNVNIIRGNICWNKDKL